MSFLFACGAPSEAGTEGSSESSSSSDATTNPTTSATTSPTTSATTASTSMTTTDTTTTVSTTEDPTTSTETTDPDTSDTDAPTSTETTDPDTSATGGESSSEGTTGQPREDYPACTEDADCTEPYELCWPPMEFGTPNFCTLECQSAKDCPVPSTGEAVPVCEGPPGTDICVLDCTDGECPDGMTCVDVFNNGQFMRCTRDA